MIVVRIRMNVIPEKQKELVQTLVSMISSMEEEPGCLSYALYCNMEDRNLLNLLEEWQTRENFDHHLRSEMFGILLGHPEPSERTAWNSHLHGPSVRRDGSR